MILYLNGDSHSVAAEATNIHAFANDDHKHWGTPHRHGHRSNLDVSYGAKLSEQLGCSWINQGESGSSNYRIMRTARIFLETSNVKDLVLLIGWSTWEREEWLHNGVYYQVTASGTDTVPADLQDKYKRWVIDSSNRVAKNEIFWHDEIYRFHQELESKNIKHLFFNTYRYFNHISLPENNIEKHNWGNSYIDPYSRDLTYFYWLQDRGYKTVSEQSYHYGADAHLAWSSLLQEKIQLIL